MALWISIDVIQKWIGELYGQDIARLFTSHPKIVVVNCEFKSGDTVQIEIWPNTVFVDTNTGHRHTISAKFKVFGESTTIEPKFSTKEELKALIEAHVHLKECTPTRMVTLNDIESWIRELYITKFTQEQLDVWFQREDNRISMEKNVRGPVTSCGIRYKGGETRQYIFYVFSTETRRREFNINNKEIIEDCIEKCISLGQETVDNITHQNIVKWVREECRVNDETFKEYCKSITFISAYKYLHTDHRFTDTTIRSIDIYPYIQTSRPVINDTDRGRHEEVIYNPHVIITRDSGKETRNIFTERDVKYLVRRYMIIVRPLPPSAWQAIFQLASLLEKI
jgi:hypothetical protein